MRVFLLSRAAFSCQLQDLSSKVLQDRCQVHGGTGTDAAGVLQQHKREGQAQEHIQETPALMLHKGICQTYLTTMHKDITSPVCSKAANKQKERSHLALLQVAGNTSHRELESGLGRPGHGLLGRLSLSAPRHGCFVLL